ncbi:EF-hand domain-containing protein, partial [Actinocorallia lasiicapitis]
GNDAAVLRAVMLGWWSALTGEAGAPDGVTLDDVLATVDLLPTMPEAVHATAEAMFEAVDADGDGTISPQEYDQMIEAWRGGPADTREVFDLLDLDHDGVISRAEFVRHWYEFWAGDDPAAPGASVFGLLHPA